MAIITWRNIAFGHIEFGNLSYLPAQLKIEILLWSITAIFTRGYIALQQVGSVFNAELNEHWFCRPPTQFQTDRYFCDNEWSNWQ